MEQRNKAIILFLTFQTDFQQLTNLQPPANKILTIGKLKFHILVIS